MRYEKGRKDSSRAKIMEVASERFRKDGIAASGLATIMKDAGLTNGAFYPHFESKAELVRESVVAAMEAQSQQLEAAMAAGGLEVVIASYLSSTHRDNPARGCASAALLPEIARQPIETRQAYTDLIMAQVRKVAATLKQAQDPERIVLAFFSTLYGTLELARAVEGKELSDRILAAGADAARKLIQPHHDEAAS
jgi:TetR/AcrR family transcriptional regulator, transcriptional repressor for nem operon